MADAVQVTQQKDKGPSTTTPSTPHLSVLQTGVRGTKNGKQVLKWWNQSRVTDWVAPPTAVQVEPDVFVLDNPDPIIRLNENSAVRSYLYHDQLVKDGHLEGLWKKYVRAILALPASVQPADEEDVYVERAAKLADIMAEVDDWNEAQKNLLKGLWVGRAGLEVQWLPTMGRGWSYQPLLETLGPDDLAFDTNGRAWYWPVRFGEPGEIPEGKLILLRNDATRQNPYGVGWGRGVYFQYWLKRDGGVKAWAFYNEKFGFPCVEGVMKAGYNESDMEEFEQDLEQLQTAGVIVHSDAFEVHLLEAQRAGTVSTYQGFCDFLNLEMSKAIFGETLSTQPSERGSSEIATVHGDIFVAAVVDGAKQLKQVLTQQLLRYVEFYNLGLPPEGRWAKWEIETDPVEDRKMLLDIFEGAQRLGITLGEGSTRKRLGIDELEDDVPLIRAASAITERIDPIPGDPPGTVTADEQASVESGQGTGADPNARKGGAAPAAPAAQHGAMMKTKTTTFAEDGAHVAAQRALEAETAKALQPELARLGDLILGGIAGKARGRR